MVDVLLISQDPPSPAEVVLEALKGYLEELWDIQIEDFGSEEEALRSSAFVHVIKEARSAIEREDKDVTAAITLLREQANAAYILSQPDSDDVILGTDYDGKEQRDSCKLTADRLEAFIRMIESTLVVSKSA